MISIWFLIPLIVIVTIFMLLKSKRKLDANFYKSLNDNQLKIEAKNYIEKIVNNFDENSIYNHPECIDFQDLKTKSQEILSNINNSKIDSSFPTSSIQSLYHTFSYLSKTNNWSKNKVKLTNDLHLIVIELLIRQGVLPKNHH